MRGKIVLKVILISAFIFLSFIVARAQNSEKFTYRDLLSQQQTEREELKQTQKETLDKILLRQKEEIELVKGNTGPVENLQGKHQVEREKIVQLQKEEREKMMLLQSEEKKNFKPL